MIDALRILTQVCVFVWLIATTLFCSTMFVVAMWDLAHRRLPLQPRHIDEIARMRARRRHSSHRRGAV